jgi:type II secretory pathway pseudopilin PulG
MITTKSKEILKKNSFTLFEVLVFLIILGITISGIARVFTQDHQEYHNFQDV